MTANDSLFAQGTSASRWQPLTGLVIAAMLPVFYGVTSEGWTRPWRRKKHR